MLISVFYGVINSDRKPWFNVLDKACFYESGRMGKIFAIFRKSSRKKIIKKLCENAINPPHPPHYHPSAVL
jgi:hypothetical protein